MSYIRSSFDSGSIISQDDSSTLSTGNEKYWSSEPAVSDTIGVWDNTNNKFIPDGLYDNTTGWLWPEGLDWSNYNADD